MDDDKREATWDGDKAREKSNADNWLVHAQQFEQRVAELEQRVAELEKRLTLAEWVLEWDTPIPYAVAADGTDPDDCAPPRWQPEHRYAEQHTSRTNVTAPRIGACEDATSCDDCATDCAPEPGLAEKRRLPLFESPYAQRSRTGSPEHVRFWAAVEQWSTAGDVAEVKREAADTLERLAREWLSPDSEPHRGDADPGLPQRLRELAEDITAFPAGGERWRRAEVDCRAAADELEQRELSSGVKRLVEAVDAVDVAEQRWSNGQGLAGPVIDAIHALTKARLAIGDGEPAAPWPGAAEQ